MRKMMLIAYWIKALDGGGNITSSTALTKSELIVAMIEKFNKQ